MKEENGYYVDENNNKWDKKRYSRERAEKLRESLINCIECVNCEYCVNCVNCIRCIQCRDCVRCTHCYYCTNCEYCSINCVRCHGCKNCTGCANCTNCGCCHRCIECADCDRCGRCTECYRCGHCDNCACCHLCENCRDCYYCSDFDSNPERIISKKIGARSDQTVVYKLDENIQVVCGCFRGSLDEFEEAVHETHGGNEFEKEYMEFIGKVKTYWEIREC